MVEAPSRARSFLFCTVTQLHHSFLVFIANNPCFVPLRPTLPRIRERAFGACLDRETTREWSALREQICAHLLKRIKSAEDLVECIDRRRARERGEVLPGKDLLLPRATAGAPRIVPQKENRNRNRKIETQRLQQEFQFPNRCLGEPPRRCSPRESDRGSSSSTSLVRLLLTTAWPRSPKLFLDLPCRSVF